MTEELKNEQQQQQQPQKKQGRSMADFRIYKGKAALQLSLKPPTISQGQTRAEYIEPGCLFLTFAPSLASDKENREYDWRNGKETVALNLLEAGGLARALRKGEDYSLFHDPGMKSDKQGQRTKALELKLKGDFNGITIKSRTGSEEKKIVVSLTPQECYTLAILLEAAIPKILGWDLSRPLENV